MSTLLAIEVDFLRDTNLMDAIDLRGIRGLQRTLANGQKKKFAQTLELSKKVVTAVNWFQSDAGKQATADAGIYWNNEEIGNKVFGWQKSYFYKVVKAGKLDDAKVELFNSLCDEAEARNEEPNRTLEGLLKFARSGGNTDAEAGGNDGENDGENDGANEPQIEVRVANVFTMTYKTEAGNVSVRVDANNVIATTNSKEEIQQAIEFLSNLINQ
jgi:hypothetical protein